MFDISLVSWDLLFSGGTCPYFGNLSIVRLRLILWVIWVEFGPSGLAGSITNL